jgi:hypothetical protein
MCERIDGVSVNEDQGLDDVHKLLVNVISTNEIRYIESSNDLCL